MAVKQLENDQYSTENAYSRLVTKSGNQHAQQVINTVFEDCDRKWRGIGLIPKSGWCLKSDFHDFDAKLRFQVSEIISIESELCIAGQILQGLKKPGDCPAFGTQCTPESPLGATMVSNEGACAAYYKYGAEFHLSV